MDQRPVRRVVTGHDAAGRAIIQEDGAVRRTQRIGGEIGPMFHEVWNTAATPAPIDAASSEPFEPGIVLAPPRNGTRIRVLDIPPEGDAIRQQSPLKRVAHPAEVARTILFLASAGTDFLTGGIVDVNGASYLRS